MATTTVKAIIDRFQVVLEGADLNYVKANEEFSFDRQPNTRIDRVYRVEDDGFTESLSVTNSVDTRLDELSVWVARKATPESVTVRDALETDLVTIERKVVADGPSNNYHATKSGREVERAGDVIVARLGFTVDYDFSLT